MPSKSQVGARRVDPGLTPSAVGRVTDGQAAADQPAVGVTAVERFLDDAVIEDPPDRIRPLAAARPGDVPCPDPEIEGTVSQRTLRHPGSALRIELQRGRVDAVAQAGRLRAVVEDVAEVAAAASRSCASVRVMKNERSVSVATAAGSAGCEEARPAGARLELRVGAEQLGSAAGAAVGARGARPSARR